MEKESSVVKLEVDGFKFEVDTDLIDDVETLEVIEDIQNGHPTKIITFLKQILGESTYTEMKRHYTEKDGRMRISTLNKVFETIFEKFDPKG